MVGRYPIFNIFRHAAIFNISIFFNLLATPHPVLSTSLTTKRTDRDDANQAADIGESDLTKWKN